MSKSEVFFGNRIGGHEPAVADRSAEVHPMRWSIMALATLSLGLGAGAQAQQAQQADMSFFITSVGPGNGADLGGLEGADAYCQQLADAVGAGGKSWHAYLSTQEADGAPAQNARDRIGQGPWQNAKGTVIAANVDELHGTNNLDKSSALDENGEQVN